MRCKVQAMAGRFEAGRQEAGYPRGAAAGGGKARRKRIRKYELLTATCWHHDATASGHGRCHRAG